MKERLQLLFLVFFFSSWGHWAGSAGRDLGETFGFGFSAIFGILLMLILSNALDNWRDRRRGFGPDGTTPMGKVKWRRAEDFKDVPPERRIMYVSDPDIRPNFPEASRDGGVDFARPKSRANGREGGVK